MSQTSTFTVRDEISLSIEEASGLSAAYSIWVARRLGDKPLRRQTFRRHDMDVWTLAMSPKRLSPNDLSPKRVAHTVPSVHEVRQQRKPRYRVVNVSAVMTMSPHDDTSAINWRSKFEIVTGKSCCILPVTLYCTLIGLSVMFNHVL